MLDSAVRPARRFASDSNGVVALGEHPRDCNYMIQLPCRTKFLGSQTVQDTSHYVIDQVRYQCHFFIFGFRAGVRAGEGRRWRSASGVE